MQKGKVMMSNKFLVVIILFVTFVIVITNWRGNIYRSNTHDELVVYDLFALKRITPSDGNIFFVESSCIFKNGVNPSGLQLNSRQACAVYSTALQNPSRKVILYHSCPLHPNFYERSVQTGKALIDLPNVYIFHTKIEDLLRGTPVETVLNGELQHSQFLVEHAADIIRLVLVYKYGGAYFDLDFVSMKPLDELPNNFVQAQSDDSISNGVFQFEHQGQGHYFLNKMLIDLGYNYNGMSWADNGPGVFTRNYIKFCNITKFQDMPLHSPTCNISIGNITTFYPIPYPQWKMFFRPEQAYEVMNMAKNCTAVHVWNFLSKKEVVTIGEKSAYELLAQAYCREILFSSGPTF